MTSQCVSLSFPWKLLRYVLDLVARAFGCQYSVRCRPADSGCKQTRGIAMRNLPTLPSEIKDLS